MSNKISVIYDKTEYAENVKKLTKDVVIVYMSLTTYTKRTSIDYESWEFVSGAHKEYFKFYQDSPDAISAKIGCFGVAVKTLHEDITFRYLHGQTLKEIQNILIQNCESK